MERLGNCGKGEELWETRGVVGENRIVRRKEDNCEIKQELWEKRVL